MKFVLIMALIIGLIMMLSTRQRRMSLTKSLFSMINRIEAKLAGLGCHSTVINELEVFYLSNTQHFNDDKPVLVLLHGFSRDSYVWNRFAKRFSAHYHLLIPDIKGHGQTAYHPSHDYSVPSQCKMLLVLLDKLQISRFSIIGNSMGGLMAAKLIIDIPDRIEKSVLIDPAGAKSEFAHYMIDNQINPFSHKVEQDFFDFL